MLTSSFGPVKEGKSTIEETATEATAAADSRQKENELIQEVYDYLKESADYLLNKAYDFLATKNNRLVNEGVNLLHYQEVLRNYATK